KNSTKFFWIMVLVAVGAALLPYGLGSALTPPGYKFYGHTYLTLGDAQVYYSYIEQGRHGAVLMDDAMTSEPQQATLLQWPWTALGLLARVFRLNNQLVFAFARGVGLALLISTLWWAIRWIWTDETSRRVALMLTVFGGGFGAILHTFWRPASFFSRSPDVWVAEGFTLLSAMSTPHFLLVTSGIVFVLVSVERSYEDHKNKRVLWAGLVSLLTLSIHPFHILTWALFWLILTGYRAWQQRKIPIDYVWRWVAVLVISSPALLYYWLGLKFDPISIGRAAQNVNMSTNPLLTLSALGIVLPLAVIAIFRYWRGPAADGAGRGKRYAWLVALATAYLVAIYVPVPFQRRLSQGYFYPFALLAVPAVVAGWQWIKTKRPAIRWTTIILSLLLLSSSWLSVAAQTVHSYWRELKYTPDRFYYIPPAYQQLYSFLERHTARTETVLTTVFDGNMLVGATSHHVFVAQSVETLHYGEKVKSVEAFFRTDDQTKQRTFLSHYSICYILYGPRERAYGLAFQPQSWTDLAKVWSRQDIELWKTPYCR
ncbi:MAG: hypothetical protein HY092_01685, partial [Candidatus Kerfeldbacteria bacterium]|nr:hypothetical protein [Candidatus Kerfeldbacteria bacterium]